MLEAANPYRNTGRGRLQVKGDAQKERSSSRPLSGRDALGISPSRCWTREVGRLGLKDFDALSVVIEAIDMFREGPVDIVELIGLFRLNRLDLLQALLGLREMSGDRIDLFGHLVEAGVHFGAELLLQRRELLVKELFDCTDFVVCHLERLSHIARIAGQLGACVSNGVVSNHFRLREAGVETMRASLSSSHDSPRLLRACWTSRRPYCFKTTSRSMCGMLMACKSLVGSDDHLLSKD